MPNSTSTLSHSAAWQALVEHAASAEIASLTQLVQHDPARQTRFQRHGVGMCLDFAFERVNDTTLRLLESLAHQQAWTQWRARMFAGEPINTTEARAAWHVALRGTLTHRPAQCDTDHARTVQLAEAIRQGTRHGATGKKFTHLVHMGTGGSDLGPRLLVDALGSFNAQRFRVDFVSNMDPVALDRVLAQCDPAQTLIVLASKSFTTQETITNASAARDWLIAGLPGGADWRQHMVAATSHAEAARAFGIHTQDILSVPVWVGGRYSIWSAIGLTPMIVIGPTAFAAFLAGGAEMDQHFLHAPFAQNLPALLALLGVWNINFLDAHTLAVLPYAHALTQLPAYLQQLDMESNGKSIDRDGRPIDYATAPVVWGAAGTVGQHSFHQLLHQGTLCVPCEFITVDTPMGDVTRHHILNANASAQAQALALGRPADGLKPWQLHPGNRPSLTLRLAKLDAHTLGALIALYEHKVFMQGCIWNINSFDQFGVEYGKQLAAEQLRPLQR